MPGDGKGPQFERDASKGAGTMETGEDLQAPHTVRGLQTALHAKAKGDPGCRFYTLSDKVWRADVLAAAWQAVRRNGGACGADGGRLHRGHGNAHRGEGWRRAIPARLATQHDRWAESDQCGLRQRALEALQPTHSILVAARRCSDWGRLGETSDTALSCSRRTGARPLAS